MRFIIKYGILITGFMLLSSCRNNDNEINVTTSDDLIVENVEIKYGFVSINRESDSELFSAGLKSVFDGKDKKNLETNFGENDFLLIYDKKYYYSFRHFIESDFVHDYPKGHDYNFHLYKRTDSIFCDVDIKGEIPMKFSRCMVSVGKAKDRIGNTPTEKAGTIFNMKEMEIKKKNVAPIIKDTQQRIKTDCFYDIDKFRIYFSQHKLNEFCDSIFNIPCSSSDSIFYKGLKDNCVKRGDKDNSAIALELILTQEIKVRDLQTDNWTSLVELTKNENNEWKVNGIFKSDTLELINKARKHNNVYSK